MNCKVYITKHDLDYIKQEYRCGRSCNSIGKQLKVTHKRISDLLRQEGIDIRLDNCEAKSEPYHQEIIKMHSEGLSIIGIKNILNLSEPTLRKVARKYDLDFTKNYKWKVPHIYTKDDIDFFKLQDGIDYIEKFHNGKKYLNRLDQKYQFDDHFFKIIDNEYKSYILGLWFADGNVTKDRIRIQLADLDLVETVKKELKLSQEIIIHLPKIKNRKIQYEIGIYKKKMVIDMIKLGCVPRKSLILKFPEDKIMPEHLAKDFIRGYLDGDGNIYNNKKTNVWRIQIVGTKEMLKGILYYTQTEAYWSKRKKDNKNNHTITIGKQSEVRKFIHYIYKDATIFLKRKKDLADRFLEEKKAA